MLTISNQMITAFSATMAPAAYCMPGETVRFVTEDCFFGAIGTEQDLVATGDISGNPATGPLYVEGAEPGDALAVDILDIETADQGVVCTVQNCGILWDSVELRTRVIPVENGIARFRDLTWAVKPMIGVIGTAPAEGEISTEDSFNGGGNMDNPCIIKGTTVYLPVRVKGGLLAMGDLHASMGEGEIAGTGIEIAGVVTVRVRVIKNADIHWPVTRDDSGWFVNTNGFTTDQAIERGYKELQRLLCRLRGWDNTDASLYISLRGIVRANQAVLGVKATEYQGPTFRVGFPHEQGVPGLLE